MAYWALLQLLALTRSLQSKPFCARSYVATAWSEATVADMQRCGLQVIEVDPSVAPIVEQANIVNTSYIVSFIKLFAKSEGTGIKGAFRRFFLE